MNTNYENMMTEIELCRLFSIVGKDGKVRDIKPPRRKRSNKRVRPVWTDTIRAGITTEKPGKRRVADLVRFYAENADAKISAFEF